jgi:hypothetical protein
MRRNIMAVFFVGAILPIGLAAQTTAPADANSAAPSIRTIVNASLHAPIDSKKAKAGDPVTAYTTEATKPAGGIALPKGTKVLGHITQSTSRAKGETQSSLGILFDKAVLKNGEEVPMHITIQAIGSLGDNQGAASPPDEVSSVNPGAPGPGSGRASGSGASDRGAGAPGSATTTQIDTPLRLDTEPIGAAQSLSRVGGGPGTPQLARDSKGVVGLKGLSLDAANSTTGSMITATGKSVHLDGGTLILLMVEVAPVQTPAPPNSKT